MPRPLTDQESEVFDAIQNASNMALVQVMFDGQETACISAINQDGEDYTITPLAVLITGDMLSRLSLDGEVPTS